jgi:hypothetical protein
MGKEIMGFLGLGVYGASDRLIESCEGHGMF